MACCILTRKFLEGIFWWNLFWAHCTLSCCWIPSGSPSCMLGTSSSPLLGVILVPLGASGIPQWRRSFNATHEDILSMPDPAGIAGFFCLRVVCGEGIAGLGVLGAPSSFILESFSCRASQYHLSSSNYSWYWVCIFLLNLSFHFPKFQPSFPTSSLPWLRSFSVPNP